MSISWVQYKTNENDTEDTSYVNLFVRGAGLMRSQQDFEWW